MTELRNAWRVAGLMLVFLAGCGPRPGDLNDPCSFLTVGEVKSILDVDRVQMAQRPRVTLTTDFESPGQICNLAASDVAHFTMFHLRVGTPEEFAREKAQVMGRKRQKAEDLPGIAEAAFWNDGTNTAAAQKKGHAVILSGIYRKADAVSLLKKAAARLP